MIADILKNFNAFIDGLSYAGKVEECGLPKLALKTDDYRAGGMDAPIKLDMGMEAMEATIGLAGYDKDSMANAFVVGRYIPIVFRGALQSEDGTVKPAVATMNGTITSVEPAAWKGGEKSGVKLTMTVPYFKFVLGGTTLYEIDVLNFKRIINGVDQLAQQRAALGM